MRYILALDQGTTSSRAVAFDETGRMVGSHGIEFPQHYPHPGWVEHDPRDILDSPTRRDSMSRGMAELGILDATERIYNTVMELVK